MFHMGDAGCVVVTGVRLLLEISRQLKEKSHGGKEGKVGKTDKA